ncbi:12022_t:CDS:2 [Ambispora leptoticha]|uniref:12022_t:CDS:1 n=1 Tax=Ambispora leptoticha TaxID=144679 RepID=A0A9N8Z3B2_9GLOM|nr:12022_t:CDS:2 [Ambispora leptoticha]
MSTATSLQTTNKPITSTNGQPSKRPGIRKIMTWNYRTKDKKHGHSFGYNSAPEDDPQVPPPASPTPSFKSVKNGRPSLFATFARRNSTKSLSENSTRSRSPTSPRTSTECGISADDFRTPSPTPSRNSMIFERDIEFHDHLSVHEAIDMAIPPVLDTLASDEVPTILTENGLRPPSPPPFDTPLIADTLRVTTPKVMNELAGVRETNGANGIQLTVVNETNETNGIHDSS